MATKECITCGEEKPESGGTVTKPSPQTEEIGIPTGFVCGECLDSAGELDGYPETPLNLAQYSRAEDAAKALHDFLQQWVEATGSDPNTVHIYSPEETQKKRDMGEGARAWTVAWEGGSPSKWATSLTGGLSMSHAEFGSIDSDPEVIGFRDAPWEYGTYYSFDIQFYEE